MSPIPWWIRLLLCLFIPAQGQNATILFAICYYPEESNRPVYKINVTKNQAAGSSTKIPRGSLPKPVFRNKIVDMILTSGIDYSVGLDSFSKDWSEAQELKLPKFTLKFINLKDDVTATLDTGVTQFLAENAPRIFFNPFTRGNVIVDLRSFTGSITQLKFGDEKYRVLWPTGPAKIEKFSWQIPRLLNFSQTGFFTNFDNIAEVEFLINTSGYSVAGATHTQMALIACNADAQPLYAAVQGGKTRLTATSNPIICNETGKSFLESNWNEISETQETSSGVSSLSTIARSYLLTSLTLTL